MRIKYFLILIGILLFFGNCNSFKRGLTRIGDEENAIQNAILDFINTSRLYKKNSVFSIGVYELINNEELLVVRIGVNNTKMLLTANTKVGSKGKIPSRFIEQGGKLFFWRDDDYPLTEKTLAVFRKYNLLQDSENERIIFPDSKIDDVQKAVHYYFCKNDLSRYKKVVTNKGVGYYLPPNLNCR